MVVADDAAAALDPVDVDAVRDVAADPHQQDQDHAEREWEAQVVMGVLGPLRPGREGIEPDQRQQHRPAEGDVEAGDGEHDEAGRRHPMHETLDRGEPHEHAAGAAVLDLHHAADQVEHHQHHQRADNENGAEHRQVGAAELLPVAALRLLDVVGLGVRDGAAAADDLHLLEELVLLHRARGRIDLRWLLRQRGHRGVNHEHQRQRADDETSACKTFRHETSHATASLFLCPAHHVAIVSL